VCVCTDVYTCRSVTDHTAPIVLCSSIHGGWCLHSSVPYFSLSILYVIAENSHYRSTAQQALH
jgi:hypothetical protein